MRGFLHLDCGVAAAQLALDHKSAVASLVSDHFTLRPRPELAVPAAKARSAAWTSMS